ncbi:hypothetical protein ACU4GD_21475 [Cupriavidus basilensis]
MTQWVLNYLLTASEQRAVLPSLEAAMLRRHFSAGGGEAVPFAGGGYRPAPLLTSMPLGRTPRRSCPCGRVSGAFREPGFIRLMRISCVDENLPAASRCRRVAEQPGRAAAAGPTWSALPTRRVATTCALFISISRQ